MKAPRDDTRLGLYERLLREHPDLTADEIILLVVAPDAIKSRIADLGDRWDLRAEISRDAAAGRKSREKGAEAAFKRYGSPKEARAAVRHAFEELRAKHKDATISALHGMLAFRFKVTQRTIRRYLKK